MRLAWSQAARADLLAIADYIDIDNPPAARAVLARIERQVACLAKQPALGQRGHVAGTRELVIVLHPYIVIYRLAGEAGSCGSCTSASSGRRPAPEGARLALDTRIRPEV